MTSTNESRENKAKKKSDCHKNLGAIIKWLAAPHHKVGGGADGDAAAVYGDTNARQ